jgi:Fe-S cluster assembly iron-binding protein IscA
MTIKLTEAAAEEVKNSKEEGHYLRVAVALGLSTNLHLT